ncbi:MAG: hypothetical protein Q7L55_08790 [Actinomycetota bacterium]|nr:hypothetical protein [Actinomycetota bacterium]
MTQGTPQRWMLRAAIVVTTLGAVMGTAGVSAARPASEPSAVTTLRQQVLRGVVSSGAGTSSLPIAGAAVVVYESTRTTARAVGQSRSDAAGRFAIAIPQGAVSRYVVAGEGTSRELVTMLGTRLPARISVNEMTTVAAAFATAQLAQGTRIAGTALQLTSVAGMAANLVSPATGMPSTVITSPPNANQTNTWRELGTLSNIVAACVRADVATGACTKLFALTGSSAHPTTWNAVQAIARNPARNVKSIFALGNRVHAFRPHLTSAFGPAARSKWMRLDAFTLAVKFNATGRTQDGKEVCPFGGLGNLTFDLRGYAWITNNVVQGTPNSTNCIVVLQPNGQPADGTAGTPSSPVTGGGILGQGFGLGFDPSGRLWSGNFGWGTSAYFPTTNGTTPGGSVSLVDGSGMAISGPYGYTSNLFRVQGTVSDARGNIWMASYGNNRVQVFPTGDPTTSYPFYVDTNTEPFDIRLDSNGDAWVSYTGTSTVSKLRFTATGVQRLFTAAVGTGANPKGVAVDSAGNAWVASGKDDAVYAFDSTGTPLGKFTGGGIDGPWGVTVDSSSSLWVANFGGVTQANVKYGISRLCGAVAGTCPKGMSLGDPMTPSTGYTLPSGGDPVLLRSGEQLYGATGPKTFKPLMRETSAEVDAAGNLWVANNWKPSGAIDTAGGNPGGDGIVVFVGIASPVQPKLFNGPPTAP